VTEITPGNTSCLCHVIEERGGPAQRYGDHWAYLVKTEDGTTELHHPLVPETGERTCEVKLSLSLSLSVCLSLELMSVPSPLGYRLCFC
jgi:hypothetical protein